MIPSRVRTETGTVFFTLSGGGSAASFLISFTISPALGISFPISCKTLPGALKKLSENKKMPPKIKMSAAKIHLAFRIVFGISDEIRGGENDENGYQYGVDKFRKQSILRK